MAGGNILSVRLDDVLEAQLQAYAAAGDLSRSAAARELLRQVLTDATPLTRGWYEGRQQAMAQIFEAVKTAIGEVTAGG
jgi:predicted transcriptional regulator